MANWDEIKKEYETTKITLSKLAEKHDIPLGTIKSQKSRDTKSGNPWVRDGTKKDATKSTRVASFSDEVATQKELKKSERYPNGHPGNKNPPNQFPKRNQAAVKHGFYSRLIPDDMQELFDELDDGIDTSDMLWDQIKLQYIAIMRAQKIMYVTDKDEMIKELKKAKYDYVPDPNDDAELKPILTEAEYEFQFAWERQAQFLTAQSRAISELRTSIKQFEEMADTNDERRLKLEKMQLDVDKTKVEIELAQIAVRKENGEENDEHEDDGFMEALGATAAEVWSDGDD